MKYKYSSSSIFVQQTHIAALDMLNHCHPSISFLTKEMCTLSCMSSLRTLSLQQLLGCPLGHTPPEEFLCGFLNVMVLPFSEDDKSLHTLYLVLASFYSKSYFACSFIQFLDGFFNRSRILPIIKHGLHK